MHLYMYVLPTPPRRFDGLRENSLAADLDAMDGTSLEFAASNKAAIKSLNEDRGDEQIPELSQLQLHHVTGRTAQQCAENFCQANGYFDNIVVGMKESLPCSSTGDRYDLIFARLQMSGAS